MTEMMRGHEMMAEITPEMRECIANCQECHAVCLETTVHCLQMGGQHAEAGHIRTLLDCAEICQTSANYMLRSSPLHHLTCGVCAEACTRCAASCEAFGDDRMMQSCAEVCRRCAESCERMARSA